MRLACLTWTDELVPGRAALRHAPVQPVRDRQPSPVLQDTLVAWMAIGTFIDELADWPGAAGLLALGLVPELLPILFGTGEHATRDWAFIYVTCHFVLLPICSVVVLLIASGVVLSCGPKRGRAVLPALIAAGFLAALLVDPLPWLRSLYRAQ